MTMTVTGACPRLFEAEAMRDGRLAGAPLASFARHTATCAACRHEVQALDALGEALRASRPDGTPADELGRLRERTRLVAAFDATLMATRRRTSARRPALWATAAAMVVGAVLLSRPRHTGDGGSASAVVVHAGPGAVWSKQTRVDHDRVVLASGELWIHVDHARQRTRLVVALPDGELEDTGTIFTVNATHGRTTRVAVSEGSVVLRIRDKPPLTLGGGESWAAAPVEAPRAPAPQGSPPASPPSDPTSHGRLRKPAAPANRAALRPSLPVPAEPAVADAGLDFRAAVAVLDVGANRQAAEAFARFLAKHPHDARAEDAAYLQIIALQRCGATDEARRAAQAYLRQFPAGFRRVEIETLSR